MEKPELSMYRSIQEAIIGVSFKPVGFKEAERELSDEGMDVMKECADAGRDEAKSRARVDERDMKNGIISEPTPDGAVLAGTDWKTPFHEWGTGLGAGSHDAQYPGLEPSRGTRAKEIPWVYWNEDAGHFVTTYGVPAQPMIRPGFLVGVETFYAEKRKRGL